MGLPYARPGTGWYTGAIAPDAAGANGAARWPVRKWIPARAGINAPDPHTAGASIQNRIGTRVFILRLPGAHGNTKKFIMTAHPANG